MHRSAGYRMVAMATFLIHRYSRSQSRIDRGQINSLARIHPQITE
jgi:hypothetical protein